MSINNSIPKIIHYCWFGNGEKTELAQKCIEGWKNTLKGYKIIEWNEENFDVNINRYVKEAYECKKYAFVSDYVRLYALLNYGGIYLDTDVEVIKDFNSFLELEAFVGFEDNELISTAIIGAKRENSIIEEWFNTYDNRNFINNGKMNEITNVRVFTNLLLKYGLIQNNTLQSIKNSTITIYPTEYFSPLKFGSKIPRSTKNTVTIHWFEGTWTTFSKKIKIKVIVIVKTVIGFRMYNKIKSYIKNGVTNEL